MNAQQWTGLVKDGRFVPSDAGPLGGALRLTTMARQASMPPESQEIYLEAHEGKTITVSGHLDGGWIYDAQLEMD